MLKRLARRRPSHATIVAYLALFVALGGSAIAASGAITGKQIKNGTVASVDIKNRSIKGVDVANNTLGGAQINEAKLGTVPSATNATNATNAGNANTVGGVTAASLKLACPPGTDLAAGNLCFESAERSAQGIEGAWNTCGDVGRRLPSPSELRAYARTPGVTLPSAEITDGLFLNGSTFEAVIVQETGLTSSNDANFARPFRCVTNPTN
jgi:hypothetical protein